jgi:hypothetical protein
MDQYRHFREVELEPFWSYRTVLYGLIVSLGS